MNNPNQTINDSQSGTNKPNATWTAAAVRSDYEQSRHYRSASGYPSGPEYVSTSRKHEKALSSGQDRRMRSETIDSQLYSLPPRTRPRDPAHPDPTHGRSAQTQPAPSKRYDMSAYRPNIPAENPLPSQPAKYELWIPPSQHSPPSQQDRHNRERDKRERDREKEKEKEKQRIKDENRRERREPTDASERHKRRQEEGESDYKDRERRERERHRERENEKARDPDHQRSREDYVQKRKEKPERENVARYRDEGEQQKYVEMELRRAEEKERVREREKEKRRQERERDRERERERYRERKDKERAEERISKTDVERDKEKERKRERREREYRREIESGRESERDPDRRRRKGDTEQVKDSLKQSSEVPTTSYNGPRRDVELEGTKKTQDVARRHKIVLVEGSPVSRDKEAERSQYATKNSSHARQKDNLGDESEPDRIRHSDKENVVRRERKIHERLKHSGINRPYAERATDSEREQPSHRDAVSLNPYVRETGLPAAFETTVASFSKPSAQTYPKDDRGLSIAQARTSVAYPGIGISPATHIPSTSETLKQTPPNDGYNTHSYSVPVSRPIDPSSTSAKYSPVSVVSANGESPRLDSTGPEVRTKQAHRTLKRQSRITSMAPEPITILPSKYGQSQEISQPPVDTVPPPSSHVPRPRKDSGHHHSTDTSQHLPPSANQASPAKVDFIGASPMTHLAISSRAYARDSSAILQPNVTYDRRNHETSQLLQKDLQVPIPEASPPLGMTGNAVNNSLNSPSVRVNQDSRTVIKGPEISAPATAQLIAPSVEKVPSSSSTKPSSRGTYHPPVVNDTFLRRPYPVLGESSPQERGERAKDKLAPVPSTGLSSSPRAPQAYPVDSSTSFDAQHPNGISEPQPATPARRLVAGMSESKSEGLQSRVHSLAPIPENATVTAAHRPASRPQTDPPSQPTVTFTDKRTPPEPTSATRVAFRSTSEPSAASSRLQTDPPLQQTVATADKRAPPEQTSTARVTFRSVSESGGVISFPVVKMKSSKSGRDDSKRVITDPYHTSYSVNPEAALRSLTIQHKQDDLVVYPTDPARSEAPVKFSPTASSRREVSGQFPMNKGPNAIETSATPRLEDERTQWHNPVRTESSPGGAAEGLLPVMSYSPPSKPSERKYDHAAQASPERHIDEPNTGASRDTARDKGDRPQLTESESMTVTIPGAALNNMASVMAAHMAAPDGKPVIAQNFMLGDAKNSDYHQYVQRPQQPVLDCAPREPDVIRKQRKDGNKKSHSPNKDHVQLGYREEYDFPLDNMQTSHREGFAHSWRKKATSPVAHVPQNSLPQSDPQSTFSEVDSRHLPHNIQRESPSGQNPASSIVKPLYQGINNRSNNSQEASPKASISRPNESPSRYPHSVYRSSSLYPAAYDVTPQLSMDYSKHQAFSSHVPTNHSQTPSQTGHSPSSHQPPFLPSRNTRVTTPVVAPDEQPLPDGKDSSNKTSSKYLRGQPAPSSPRIARPDSSRTSQSKPFAAPTNPQFPEVINHQAAPFPAEQRDMNSRMAEPSPTTLPSASLLLSKGTDHLSPYIPPEQKGTGDSRSLSNSHLAGAAEHSHGLSPNSHEFEKHEPRLITPKSQKLPELSELQQRNAPFGSAKVKAPEPYQEAHKKSSSLDAVKTKTLHNQTYPPEIWHPPASSREYEPERMTRRQVVSVTGSTIPRVLHPQPSTSIGMMLPLDEDAEQARLAQNGEHVTDMKVYRYLREKRNRTISVLSIEAQDGAATSTLGSPTASILSQPPIRVPSHRDPMKAAHEWLSENMEAAAKRGKTAGKRRILRPGVVFDVDEDPPLTERRHRSKSSRSKTQPSNGTRADQL